MKSNRREEKSGRGYTRGITVREEKEGLEYVLITARTSPWKSESRNLVLRRKARAHAGSRCSTTDMRCESRYAICLEHTR